MVKSLKSIFFGCLIGLLGCEDPPLPPEPPSPEPYSFFVAGHAYGDPEKVRESPPGLFPPFIAHWDSICGRPNMELGVLTGDVVKYSDTLLWQAAGWELTGLHTPIYLAPGNHDVQGERLHPYLFNNSYCQTQRNGDLFIILDPEIDGWNVPEEQLHFLDTLLARPERYRNIFVFFHQVLWLDTSKPREVWKESPNNVTERDSLINFKTEVEPKFMALPNPVWFFAGDVGAYCTSYEVTIHSEGNKHYLTSGMGCFIRSNYLIVDVDAAGKVKVEVIWLNIPRPSDGGPIDKYRY